MKMRALAYGVALLATSACAAMRGRNAAPHIDAVEPDSVAFPSGAVVQVVLRGRAFAPGTPGQNVVQFGDVRLTSVPANADGTQIRFALPDRVPVRGDAAPLPLESGRYSIHVETPAGSSNSVTLRVDR